MRQLSGLGMQLDLHSLVWSLFIHAGQKGVHQLLCLDTWAFEAKNWRDTSWLLSMQQDCSQLITIGSRQKCDELWSCGQVAKIGIGCDQGDKL
jgi:hypothetical protein